MITKFIQPEPLRALVWNTAPFLEDRRFTPPPGAWDALAPGPEGFLAILFASDRTLPEEPEQALPAYFALCLAAHWATVATYAPTDVDSKIRGLLWRETKDPAMIARLSELAFVMHEWSLKGISRRWDTVHGSKPVSGHDGEWISVIVGALGRAMEYGDQPTMDKLATALDEELEREAQAFRLALAEPGLELLTLRLAMSITHNVGDLDQGIGYWESKRLAEPYKARFARLAHENRNAYQGTFQIAARLYRDAMATEGHRHYPLREARQLRTSADLLLPLGPFFDDWGALVARHPALDGDGRPAVLEALVTGCKKVANQQGYYRALAGWREADPGGFDRCAREISNSAQKLLRDAHLRQLMAVPRASFESMMKKKVLAVRNL